MPRQEECDLYTHKFYSSFQMPVHTAYCNLASKFLLFLGLPMLDEYH